MERIKNVLCVFWIIFVYFYSLYVFLQLVLKVRPIWPIYILGNSDKVVRKYHCFHKYHIFMFLFSVVPSVISDFECNLDFWKKS